MYRSLRSHVYCCADVPLASLACLLCQCPTQTAWGGQQALPLGRGVIWGESIHFTPEWNGGSTLGRYRLAVATSWVRLHRQQQVAIAAVPKSDGSNMTVGRWDLRAWRGGWRDETRTLSLDVSPRARPPPQSQIGNLVSYSVKLRVLSGP